MRTLSTCKPPPLPPKVWGLPGPMMQPRLTIRTRGRLPKEHALSVLDSKLQPFFFCNDHIIASQPQQQHGPEPNSCPSFVPPTYLSHAPVLNNRQHGLPPHHRLRGRACRSCGQRHRRRDNQQSSKERPTLSHATELHKLEEEKSNAEKKTRDLVEQERLTRDLWFSYGTSTSRHLWGLRSRFANSACFNSLTSRCGAT